MAEHGVKTCTRCHETKPENDFPKHRRPDRIAGKTYFRSYCLACQRAEYDPVAGRDRSLRRRYGISAAQFDVMLAEQGGCAACGSKETDGKYWHVDHDHACCDTQARSCGRCVRAILCHGCNTALGNVGDSKARLLKLIAYLEGFE